MTHLCDKNWITLPRSAWSVQALFILALQFSLLSLFFAARRKAMAFRLLALLCKVRSLASETPNLDGQIQTPS